MIRVAHLIHTIAYTGVETAVLNWLSAIDKSRFDVHLFCFANPGETERQFLDVASARGFAVERIPWNRRKPVLRAARELARYIRERRIDILHCHNTYAQLVTLAVQWLTGVKTITTFYVWGDFGWKRNVLQWVDIVTAPLLDEVSAHCERTLADTVRRGIPSERVRLLTCGFDVKPVVMTADERRLKRLELGAGPDDMVLLYVARFWPEKAHNLLLEAFREVVNRHPRSRLWLAGTGPGEPAMRALAERLSLHANTRFLGYRTDIPELLSLADIQVHPSDMEGVALAIGEGMAAGLPIVATAVGGLVEVLRDNESALLVQPRRRDELVNAIVRTLEDAALRSRLGAAAQRFILDDYSLAAAAARLEGAYAEMLAR